MIFFGLNSSFLRAVFCLAHHCILGAWNGAYKVLNSVNIECALGTRLVLGAGTAVMSDGFLSSWSLHSGGYLLHDWRRGGTLGVVKTLTNAWSDAFTFHQVKGGRVY